MKYPKISVVTPSYNQGEVFRTDNPLCLVINQNYPNLEHVIMNDKNIDNSDVFVQNKRLFYV